MLRLCAITALLLFSLSAVLPAAAEPSQLWNRNALTFSGYSWDAKNGYYHPGKNHWRAQNAWVDAKGWLHLQLTQTEGTWHCAEVASTSLFSYGLYRFQVAGRIDQLDKNAVLGLFLYPGPQLRHRSDVEIDVEFSRWGKVNDPPGNFTVLPNSWSFPVHLQGELTTHQILWLPDRIEFSSYHGHGEPSTETLLAKRTFSSGDSSLFPTPPLQLHINYWLFKGLLPEQLNPQEIIIRRVDYTPAGNGKL